MPKLHLVCLLWLASAAAQAHDLWIERSGLTHTLIYGHAHSGHAGAGQLAYRPDTVRRGACFNPAGAEIPVSLASTSPVTLQADCAASYFLTSSGYWSKTPYGTKNLPKSEAGAVLDSWLSLEGVKRIDRWSAALGRVLSQDLELVPLDNPLALKQGDKLHVRVYFQGRPIPGVTVAYFGKPRGVSDAAGEVNVRLKEPGFQLIQASLELPLNDAKADKAIHATALHFELP